MKIWQLRADSDNFSSFQTRIPFTGIELSAFDGRSHKDDTKLLKVEKKDWKAGMRLSDAPSYIIPVFSQRALHCLMPLIKGNVEALRLEYDEDYYAINVTTVIDAIDYENSRYITLNAGNRVANFSKYCFLPEKLKNVSIFKITDERRGFPLVSDEFKQIVEAQNLEGFKFRLLWDSEKN